MLKKAKIAFLLVMALVFAVQSIPVAEAEVINKLTAEYIFDSLGDAVNYGTVAREWEQRAHAETSVCVDDWERFSDEVFANSGNTYFHAMAYDLEAEISASESLQGMTFALYKETANGYERCEGTENTISDDTTSTVLTWRIGEELKNTRLYVFRTNGDDYIQEGSQDGIAMKLTYGPSVGAAAQNENYIGKIIYHIQKGEGDTMGVFNTSDYSPGLVFGPETRAYYKKWNQELQKDEYFVIDPNDKNLVVNGSNENGSVLVNYFYSNKADYDPETDEGSLEMGYMKLDGLSFVNGVFYRGGGNGELGNIIHVRYVDEDSYADKLVTNAEKFSKELGNMGGGELDSVVVDPNGGSSVTGPVDAEGHVVSIYDVEVGMETDRNGNYTFSVAEDTSVDGIPVASNEYVIVNLICPSKDCTVQMSNISYYHEGGKDDQVQWGSKDSNSSQHVIFNFVYADENGIMQPFEGTIIPTSGHGGTLLAPKALVHLTAQSHNGSIIADKVNNEQEIHQRTLAPLGRRTWVKMDGGYITLEKASLGYDWGDNRWEDMSANTSLAGAVFGVYSSSNCSESSLVTTMTTNAQGVATSEMIAAGTYWVKEITPLKDHELNTDVVKVTVVAGQEPTKVQGGGYSDGYIWVGPGMYDYEENWIIEEDKFVNQQNEGVASLRLEKVDELGNVLPGAVFGIYDDYRCRTQDLVGTMKTNYNGVAVYEGLPLRFEYGHNGSKNPKPYYVKEISAPEGYAVSGHVATVRLTENDRNKMVTVDGNGNADGKAFTNSIIRGNLALKKVDANTGKGLDGAKFTIYSDKDCTQPVGKVMITDANGVATSANVIEGEDGLIPGTYYVKETKAPTGYALPNPNNAYEVKVVSGKLVDVANKSAEISAAGESTGIGNQRVVKITGTKTWHDTGFTNERPQEIIIGLYRVNRDAQGKENLAWIKQVKISKEDNATFAFEDLPYYDNEGNVIEYRIVENLIGASNKYHSYVESTTDDDGNMTVSVVNSIRKTKINGQKLWTDTVGDWNDSDKNNVKLLLYQQIGTELVPVLDQSGNHMQSEAPNYNQFKFEFVNLPSYDANGDPAVYVVKEAESDKYVVVDYKESSETQNSETTITVTLTNMLTVPLSGTKVWNDNSNAKGARPDNVTLTVYRADNDRPLDPQPTIEWDKETNTDVWTWKVLNLPKYDGSTLLSYYVKEEEVVEKTRDEELNYAAPVYSNPSSDVTDKALDGGTITNSLTGRIRLYKESEDGIRLNGVAFDLYKEDGTLVDRYYTEKTGSENGKLTIAPIPYGRYYLVEAETLDGYILSNEKYWVTVDSPFSEPSDIENGAPNKDNTNNLNVVINKKTASTGSIVLTKTDADTGELLSGAVFTVYSDEACATSVGNMVEDTANPGVYTLDGLTVGQTYYVKETGAPTKTANNVEETYRFNADAKYPVVVMGENTQVNNGTPITNKAITSVSVEKVWNDNNNAANKRPISIDVQLLANDEAVADKVLTLNQENGWEGSFTDLDKYAANGQEITYTVDEVKVPADYIQTVNTEGDKATITNTYVASVSVPFAAKKTLDGADCADGKFTFNMTGEKIDGVATATNGENGVVTFPAITYTLADMVDTVNGGYLSERTFTYTISEVAGNAAGVVYDAAVYTAEVTLSYDAEAGALTVDVIYNTSDQNPPVFENKYKAESCNLTLDLSKELVNKEYMPEGDYHSFNFEMKAAEGCPVTHTITASKQSVSFSSADDKLQQIEDAFAVTFDAEGEYTFTVSETNGCCEAIESSANEYTIVVDVKDIGGQLEAQVKSITYGSEPADAIAFVNTLVLTEVSVTKVWADGEPADADVADLTDNLILYANGMLVNAQPNRNGNEYTWSNLPKYSGGQKIDYTVKEDTLPEGYKVSYENDLSYAVDGGTITNTKAETETVVKVQKLLNLVDVDKLEKEEALTFTFKIEPADPAQEGFEIVNPELKLEMYGDGTRIEKIGDLKIKFTKDGTYTFNVTEEVPEDIPDGLFYGAGTETVTIVVVKAEDGSLAVDGTVEQVVSFDNQYGEQKLVFTKAWNDANSSVTRPENIDIALKYCTVAFDETTGEFVYGGWEDFEGYNAEKYSTAVTKNGNKWSITIEGLPYYIDGEEVKFAAVESTVPTGYTASYANSQVEFEDDISKVVTGGTITNTATVSATIELSKSLEGKTLEDGMFSFELLSEDKSETLATVTNKDGKVTFSNVGSYTEVGEHTYYVREVLPKDGEDNVLTEANGIIYDAAVYEVKVTVGTDADGQLKATVDFGEQKPEFKNKYEAKGTSLALSFSKELKNAALLPEGEEHTFGFVLEDEAGMKLSTSVTFSKADKTKPVAFGLNYTTEGMYKYKLYESDVCCGAIEGSKTKYEVVVEVTDDGTGNLSAAVKSITKDGETAEEMAFVNTYHVTDITVTKVWEGSMGYELTEKDLHLYKQTADGEKAVTGKFTAENGVYTWSELPKYDAQGQEIVYFVEEDHQANHAEPKYDNTDNADADKAVVTDKAYDGGKITNTYEANGEVKLAVEKILNGREFQEGDSFEFTLTAKDDAPLPENGTTVTLGWDAVTNAMVKSGNFGTIKYDLADKDKTYTYIITETVPENKLPGVTYDTTPYEVTVAVTDNGNGQLTAAANYGKNKTAVEITNTYAEEAKKTGELTLAVKKAMNGRDFQTGDSFTFKVTGSEGAPLPEKGEVTIAPTSGTEAAVDFGTINFTEEDVGEYTYTIQEVLPAGATAENNYTVNGVTYDTMAYEVTVTVANEAGQDELTVTAVYPSNAENVTITNTYAEEVKKTGELTLAVKKAMNGRDFQTGDSFTFKVTGNEGAPLPKVNGETVTEVTIAPTSGTEAAVDFGMINFTEEDVGKTYIYTIQETVSENKLPGVTYDTTAYEVTVTVANEAGQDELTVTAVYPNNAENVTITNTYVEEVEKTGELTLAVKKVMSGRDFQTDDSFTFKVTGSEGAPMPKVNGETVTEVTIAPTSGAEAAVNFGMINFTEEDVGKTYIYTIQETVPENKLPGVTYDTTAYEVTVTVANEAGQDELTVTAVYPNNAENVTITNTYVEEVEKTGELTLAVKKAMNGRDFQTGDSFTFKVTGSDGAPMPEKGEVTIAPTSGTEAAVDFGTINFTEEDVGEYTYTIQEVLPAGATAENNYTVNGVTYDTMAYEVKVTVANEAGQDELTVTAVYPNNAENVTITNTYAEEVKKTGELTLAVKKAMNGRDFQEGDSFTFKVTGSDGAPRPEKGEVTIAPTSGTEAAVDFGMINFTEENVGKEYTYTIQETVPENKLPGVIYDTTPYQVKVTVANEASKEDLTVTAVYPDDKKELIITNTKLADGEAVIQAKKIFTNGDLSKTQFTFQLLDEDKKVVDEKSNDASGIVTFEKLTYTEAKDYTYTIKEVLPAGATAENNYTVNGITYDHTEHTVTVEVVQDEVSKKLVATVTYENGVEMPVFENTYDAKDATLELSLSKTLTNNAKLPEGRTETFTFVLADEDGVTKDQVEVSFTNTSDATLTVSFDALTFDAEGTYNYTISEIASAKSDIISDATRYFLEVDVEDVNGQLVATPTLTKQKGTEEATSAEEIVFTNTYDFDKFGELTLAVKKAMSGREFQTDDSFTFKVTGDNGAPLPEVNGETVTEVTIKPTSGTEATVDFGTINFTEEDVGEYTYTIQETVPENKLPGVTYDTTEYKVTVKVAEGADALIVTPTYANGKNVTITNTYDANGKLLLTATKTVTGDSTVAEQKGAFKFGVYDQSGTEVATGTNGEGGNITFSEIAYTLDQTGTHLYTVKEIPTVDAAVSDKYNVTFDETEYEILVNVVNNAATGNLDVTWSLSKPTNAAALVFTNDFQLRVGKIGVLKVDSRDTTKGLSGAEFTVYTDEGCTEILMLNGTKAIITTGETGAGSLAGVPIGTYWVKETKVPDGYTMVEDATYMVEVVDDGEIAMVNGTYVTNKRLAKVALEKSDRLNKDKKLPGAEYTLFTEEECENILQLPDGTLAIITTGANGVGELEGVPAGTYWVKETKAPTGYEVDPIPYEVIVAEDADPDEPVFVEVSDFPLRGALSLSKTVVANTEVDDTFLFDIDLTMANGDPIVGSYEANLNGAKTDNVTFVATETGAKATVELKDGDTLTIYGLRAGVNYTVTEQMSSRYEVEVNGVKAVAATGTISDTAQSIVNYQNTLKETGFTVEKVWLGEDAGEIKLTLYANGVAVDPQPAVTREGNTYSYADLMMNDENGKEIVYTVKETAMAGYTTTYENKAPYADKTDAAYNGGKIINRAMTTFAVKKEWSGLAQGEKAPAIQLTLYCNGTVYTAATPTPDKDGWYTYTDLPAYVDGKLAVYTVKEQPVTGFTTTYLNKGENAAVTDCAYNGSTIVNSKIPQTGDNAPLALWMLTTLLAACGLMGVMAALRKREN